MFEFHGWAVLVDSPSSEVDDLTAAMLDAVERVLVVFGEHQIDLVTTASNDLRCVRMNGLRNHHDSRVVDAFAAIGSIAPGSYGVLYVMEEHADSWDVWVLRRGQVTRHEDSFISPRIDVLEDPWEEGRVAPPPPDPGHALNTFLRRHGERS